MGSQGRGEDHLSYRPELDGIRAFAVLAVMIYHGTWGVEAPFYRGGFLGVDVFFVLSGYLITTLLLREWEYKRRIKLGNFYARRALRLLPALFLTIVVGAVVARVVSSPFARPYRESAILSATYVANWFQIKQPLTPLGHTWSLSIEEQYYLVWPAVLSFLLTRLRSRRTFACLVFGAALAMSIARYITFARGRADVAALSTFTRPDGILIGSALALALDDAPQRFRRLLERTDLALVAAAIVFLLSLTLLWTSPALYRGGWLLVNVCTAIVVGHLVVKPRSALKRVLSLAPLPWVGRISYGLYLFHIPVLYLVYDNPVRRRGAGPVLGFFVLTFAVAAASYLAVERPILKLKSRFGSMSRIAVRAG